MGEAYQCDRCLECYPGEADGYAQGYYCGGETASGELCIDCTDAFFEWYSIEMSEVSDESAASVEADADEEDTDDEAGDAGPNDYPVEYALIRRGGYAWHYPAADDSTEPLCDVCSSNYSRRGIQNVTRSDRTECLNCRKKANEDADDGSDDEAAVEDDTGEDGAEQDEEAFACEYCSREFDSNRGRSIHVGRAHGGDGDSDDRNPYDDLNDTQQRAVDKVITEPEKTDREICEELGMGETYVSNIRGKYPEIIEARREELDDGEAGDDADENDEDDENAVQDGDDTPDEDGIVEIDLPDDTTREEIEALCENHHTVYEVSRGLNLSREATSALLRRLDLMDYMGRPRPGATPKATDGSGGDG